METIEETVARHNRELEDIREAQRQLRYDQNRLSDMLGDVDDKVSELKEGFRQELHIVDSNSESRHNELKETLADQQKQYISDYKSAIRSYPDKVVGLGALALTAFVGAATFVITYLSIK